MKPKTILNGAVLFVGLGLAAYSWLNGVRVRFNIEDVAIEEQSEDNKVIPEEWRVKKGSIYDDDTLRVIKGNEELKIRFCGMQRIRADRA